MSHQDPPVLSVIMPVYNAEQTVSRTIKSVLAQSFGNFQLICVDDKSTDSSAKIIKEYAQNDDRVTYVLNSKSVNGVSSARNLGLENAIGEYITFIDADDVISVDAYQTMIENLSRKNVDAAFCEFEFVDKNSTVIVESGYEDGKIYQKEYIRKNIAFSIIGLADYPVKTLCSVWTGYFKRSVIQNNHLQFNEKRSHGEDYQFVIDYLSMAESITFVNKPFYHYYRYEGSQVSKYRDNYFDIEIYSRKHFMELYPDLPWECERAIYSFLNIPIKSLDYYSKFLDGKEFKIKAQKISAWCVEHKALYQQYKDIIPDTVRLKIIKLNKTLLTQYFMFKYKKIWIIAIFIKAKNFIIKCKRHIFKSR